MPLFLTSKFHNNETEANITPDGVVFRLTLNNNTRFYVIIFKLNCWEHKIIFDKLSSFYMVYFLKYQLTFYKAINFECRYFPQIKLTIFQH